MALVPAGPARRRAAMNAFARGAAVLTNPEIRAAVTGAGRKARAMYDEWTRPAPKTHQPKGPAPRRMTQPAPVRQRLRNRVQARRNNAGGVGGVNPALESHKPASSKPYRTGFCREKIMDIAGSTGSFAIATELIINPANTLMFPLGAELAKMHEQYEFKRGFIRLCYETTSYTAVTGSTSAGVVVMGTNIDTGDLPPVTISQAENQYGMSRCPPYAPRCVHNVPLNHLPLKNLYNHYASNELAPADQTQAARFYDVGVFRLCTANQPNTSNIGELWVEYDLTLIRRKQVYGTLGQYLHLCESPANSSATATLFGTTGPAIYSGSTGVIKYTVQSVNSFSIDQGGRYILNYSIRGSTQTTTPSLTLGSALTQILVYDNQTTSYNTSFTSNIGMQSVCFDVNVGFAAASRTITFGGSAGLAAGSTDVWVHAIPQGTVNSDHKCVRRPAKPAPITLDDATNRLLATEARLQQMARNLESRAHEVYERNIELEEKNATRTDDWNVTGHTPAPTPIAPPHPQKPYFGFGK
jgi:hypothetical protein